MWLIGSLSLSLSFLASDTNFANFETADFDQANFANFEQADFGQPERSSSPHKPEKVEDQKMETDAADQGVKFKCKEITLSYICRSIFSPVFSTQGSNRWSHWFAFEWANRETSL